MTVFLYLVFHSYETGGVRFFGKDMFKFLGIILLALKCFHFSEGRGNHCPDLKNTKQNP